MNMCHCEEMNVSPLTGHCPWERHRTSEFSTTSLGLFTNRRHEFMIIQHLIHNLFLYSKRKSESHSLYFTVRDFNLHLAHPQAVIFQFIHFVYSYSSDLILPQSMPWGDPWAGHHSPLSPWWNNVYSWTHRGKGRCRRSVRAVKVQLTSGTALQIPKVRKLQQLQITSELLSSIQTTSRWKCSIAYKI